MNDALYGRVQRSLTRIYEQLSTREERLEFQDAVEWAKNFDDLPAHIQEIIKQAEGMDFQSRLMRRIK